ncbi:YaiI/YqxD family protein [Alkalihalobacterium elongatum]|uniref:YaiI/YqxD family protein n=1 Tax=Alkalihalobacterium elongatum TaxID=2675466 RepID=UPI001C200929|nr:YaiI/YqxD family protein [Alkalihalobacterium elongatum]
MLTKSYVYVDADSCPVKDEILAISSEYNVEVVFVSSYSHDIRSEHAKIVRVDSDKEAADLFIMNHAKKNDVIVTQDHALASILVGRGASVLSPRGKVFSEDEMITILQLRHWSQKQRRSGNKTKGPKAFTSMDRKHFCNNLRKILEVKKEFAEKGRNDINRKGNPNEM